jgi:transaldolase
MDDNSLSGLSLIADISKVYKEQLVDTKILAASIRDVQSVGTAINKGSDKPTIPPSVFDNMVKHVLTDKGLEQFKRDFDL